MKITLRGSQPSIWRRVEVPSLATLADLHNVVQIAMGWQDSHMHLFRLLEQREQRDILYSDIQFGLPDVYDEAKVKLCDLFRYPKQVLNYEYDFGDNWDHELLVEALLDPDPTATYPRCVGGARACPPEDCGGIWGYEELLELLGPLKTKDQYARYRLRQRELAGLTPAAFPLAMVNEQLARYGKRRALGVGRQAQHPML
jgi:hypothetical protein